LSASVFYSALRELGFQDGASFQGIQQVWCRIGEALARIVPPESILFDMDLYHIHPALLDACIQVLLAALSEEERSLYVPMGFDHMYFYKRPDGDLWSWGRLQALEPGVYEGALTILDGQGQPLVEIVGLRLKRMDKLVLTSLAGKTQSEKRTPRMMLLAEPLERRAAFLETYLCRQVARILGLPASRIERTQRLNSLAFDSIMAMELKYQIEADLEIDIPITTFSDT